MKRFKARVKRIDIVECICSGETEEEAINNALSGDILKELNTIAVDDELLEIEEISDDEYCE